jgi:hypothetical protein
MFKKVFLISLMLLFVVGCSSNGGSEEMAQGPAPQVFVFPGLQEERLISQEVVDLPNCTGNAESSQEVTRAHTVLYTLELGLEITVSADGRAGIPGIGEVGVGAAVATNYQVGYGRSETVSRSQRVAAAPASHMQHTIQQFEIWETGEVLIVTGDTNQRLPYSFRRDFSIEAVAPANIGCPGNPSPPADNDGANVEDQPTEEGKSENPKPSPSPYEDWIVCWHGSAGHEFLAAYPKKDVEIGIDLSKLITIQPWDNEPGDLTNDSLKQCLVDGIWYGQSDPAWFPSASYLRFEGNSFVTCEHSPGCNGQQWRMHQGDTPPSQIISLLVSPTGNRVQLLNYIESEQIR